MTLKRILRSLACSLIAVLPIAGSAVGLHSSTPAAAGTNPSILVTYPMPAGCAIGNGLIHGFFALGFGPDGNLYGNTSVNACEAQINPATGAYVSYPGYLGGGEVYNYLSAGNHLYIAGYGLYSPLMAFDPSQPWVLNQNPAPYNWTASGSSWDHNQWRAHGAVIGPDGKLYFGGCNGYDRPYGNIVVWDPSTNNIQWFDQPVQGQSVEQLTTANGYVVGGTIVNDCEVPPSPAAPSAKIFLWDTHSQSNVFETVPVPNAQAIWSLGTASNGKVYGFADSHLFIFDPVARTVTVPGATLANPAGNLYPMPDGTLWGVSQQGVYKIDTSTNAVTIMVPFSDYVNPQSVRLHNGVLYYAKGDPSNTIWQYQIPSSSPPTPTSSPTSTAP